MEKLRLALLKAFDTAENDKSKQSELQDLCAELNTRNEKFGGKTKTESSAEAADLRNKLERKQNELEDTKADLKEAQDALGQSKIGEPEATPESSEAKYMESEIEGLIKTGDKKAITNEFRAMARKSTLQKEHNAQLLVRILKLQGNIQVCCRVRPMTNEEIRQGAKKVVDPLSDSEVGVLNEKTKSWKSFSFDKVWGPDARQLDIFQDIEPLALSVVDGYNACIFAYGQTGSGKTFTMEGGQGLDRGISFRTIEKVFNLLQYRVTKQDALIKEYESGQSNQPEEKPGRFEFSIKIGMLEIYNDNVHDLLVEQDKRNKKTPLEIKRNKEGATVVAGLTHEPVSDLKDIETLMKSGNINRATASTNLNEHSSRSHMVLSLEVKSGIVGEEPTTGILYLVDLAGSERVKKSAVDGDELKEATHINKSLSALGNVMEALDKKSKHVPYRDSKLTYLLRDSLGGNSRTMMVVAVRPTSTSSSETSNALQFATRVRRVKIGSAKRNIKSKNLEQNVKEIYQRFKKMEQSKLSSDKELKAMKKENALLRGQLRDSPLTKSSSIRSNDSWSSSDSSLGKLSSDSDSVILDKKDQTDMKAQLKNVQHLHENALTDLEIAQNESNRLQNELNDARQEIDRLKGGIGVKVTQSLISPNANVNPEDAKKEILRLFKDHDPGQSTKIDTLMRNFKGREGLLLAKMSRRYEGNTNYQGSSRRLSGNSETSASDNESGEERDDPSSSARNIARQKSGIRQKLSGGKSASSPIDDATPKIENNLSPLEVRETIRVMFKKHDPDKLKKLDALMDGFKGRETFLLDSLSSKYNT